MGNRRLRGISVIIPTLNAEAAIETLIQRLQQQTYPPHEVLIIDSSSEDSTVAKAKAAGAKTVIIPREKFNHGLTRNFGTSMASGEIFVFMTQDALPGAATTLENLVQPLLSGEAVAVYARQIPYPDANPIEQFWRTHNYPDTCGGGQKQGTGPYFFSNVCSAFSRVAFLAVGGFSAVETNEDMLMAFMLKSRGFNVIYQSEATVLHSHNFSFSQQFRRYYLVGRFLQRHSFLQGASNHSKQGFKAFLSLLEFLVKRRYYRQIPVAVLDTSIRYLGYLYGRLSVRIVNK